MLRSACMKEFSDDALSYQNTYHDFHFVQYLPVLPPSYSESMNLQAVSQKSNQKFPRRLVVGSFLLRVRETRQSEREVSQLYSKALRVQLLLLADRLLAVFSCKPNPGHFGTIYVPEVLLNYGARVRRFLVTSPMTRHKGAQWSQLSGFTLIFLALWALLDPRRSYVLDLVNFSDDDPLLRAAVCLSMLTGLLTLIVGFVACCGAIKKSRCMLVTFAGDSISAYMTNMTHNRYNRDYWVTPLIDAVQYYFLVNNFDVKLRTLIRDEYGIRLRNERNAHITSLIDRLQFYEECCGSQNATNWNGSRWRITIDSSLSSMESDSRAYSLFNSVPPTCCVQLVGATPINPVARSLARCQQPEASKTWRHQPQQCCGGLGPRDYYDSFWYKTNVLRGTRSFVPPSCCKQTQRARSSSIQPVDSMCTTYTYYSSPFNSSVNIEACALLGCHEKLLLWLDTQTTIFASVGFSFAAFQMSDLE
ncbi:unnamed protein product [Toxocara canis]|uniref:Tetraspanin n=1 Tax=Toxocara canis TaxID=6265 RepID=A0A3P7F8A1_TOXCA|nr:unnamed protein product [Toxocara canis]